MLPPKGSRRNPDMWALDHLPTWALRVLLGSRGYDGTHRGGNQFEFFPFRALGDFLFSNAGICVLLVDCVAFGKGFEGVSAVPVTCEMVMAAPRAAVGGAGSVGGGGSARWVICCEHRRVRRWPWVQCQ